MLTLLAVACLAAAAPPVVVLEHTHDQLPVVARGRSGAALVSYGYPPASTSFLLLDHKLRPRGAPHVFADGLSPVIVADGDAWLVAYQADRPQRGTFVAKLSASGARLGEARLGAPAEVHGDRVALAFDDVTREGLAVWTVNGADPASPSKQPASTLRAAPVPSSRSAPATTRPHRCAPPPAGASPRLSAAGCASSTSARKR